MLFWACQKYQKKKENQCKESVTLRESYIEKKKTIAIAFFPQLKLQIKSSLSQSY